MNRHRLLAEELTRVDVRPVRRATDRRLVTLLAASLTVGLLAAVAALPGWATAAPPPARAAAAPADPPAGPAGDPGDETPPVEPTPAEPTPTEAPPTLPPPPETTAPAPTTTGPAPSTPAGPADPPTTTAPATTAGPSAPTTTPPVRTSAPGPGAPAPGRLGVRVSTDDVVLTDAYWNAAGTTTTLRITVTNTGDATEQIRLSYTLPAGLTDAGTAGCAPAGGGGHRCGAWTTAAGARFSTLISVRVDGDAWRRMPLSGAVRVSATAPGVVAGSVDDNEGFAVLFPPGPPVPGIALRADGVAFDISGSASELAVRLGNTGTVDADGRIEVVLPDGVTIPAPPAGCAALSATRTRCDVGAVRAGGAATLRLTVSATAEAQRDAPLAGAVVGRLDPRSGQARQLQMSFRITAAAAMATPIATPAPAGSQGVLAAAGAGDRPGGGLSTAQRGAVALIVISVLLVVLALALATVSLRRRLTDPSGGR
ncbi:hypothetical protein AB0B88_10740 [Micromonospora haikouensis]|uniref:hypothetical protein n=1 Tax=Micromonospora haikouensis TaxID=686309 RepID=UPI0033E4449A